MRQQQDSTCEPAEEMQRLRDVASTALDVVFESSQVMMCAVDHHFGIAKVNHRWAEGTGFQRSEVLGRKLLEFGTADSRAYVKSKVIPHVHQFGFVRQVPVCLINKEGLPLDTFLDIQICRTGSCFALAAWYDRECPMQLERASWAMRILFQLSRLQHEVELFWPAFDGHSSAISLDEIGATQLRPSPNTELVGNTLAPAPSPELMGETMGPASLLSVDLEYHRVTINDKPVSLTPREWAMLRVLVTNAGRVIRPRQLLQEAWGPEYSNEFDYVRAYIRRLRRKLESDPKNPRHILLERGIGYRLVL